MVSQDVHITVLTSYPRRYDCRIDPSCLESSKSSRLSIKRIWIPYFGSSFLFSAASYSVYFFVAIIFSVFYRPRVVIGTTAKLFTSLVSAIASKLTGAKFFLDIRDTFSDNFFYFYRWNKRVLLQSFILAIENIVLRSADSINLVSSGFRSPFYGFERLLEKYNIDLTFYPNSISSELVRSIQSLSFPKYDVSNPYKIVYAGNLGEGQNIFGLLADFQLNPENLLLFDQYNFEFHIYGSGAQSSRISSIVTALNQNLVSPRFFYHGLIPRSQVHTIYPKANCLMLQLGSFSSLSYVIPTKSLEYCCTPLPIVYGASGFTSKFLSEIDGSLSFRQLDSTSFIDSCKQSLSINVSVKSRNDLVAEYSAEKNYKEYAQYIINHLPTD